MIRRALSLLLLAGLALLGGRAMAWDTAVHPGPRDSWRSIYLSDGDSVKRALLAFKNEHPVLAEMALKELGVEKQFGFAARAMDVVDLNASIFRPWLHRQTLVPRQRNDAPLEIRRIPAPPQFSGIPDYSYALYDWINKNTLCPADIPEGEPFRDRCHLFRGWMGALNANHFGSQATTFYHHLHALALNLAHNAQRLRKKFGNDATALAAYGDYVREAMAVEGYAQHFLQDRWSMGHMWERWNASDFGALPYKDFPTNMEIAAASGLLHGSEGVTGMPDAMSSPLVNIKKVNMIAGIFQNKDWDYVLPTWRHHLSDTDREILGGDIKSSREMPGAGDERLADVLDHRFGEEYKDLIGRDFAYEVGEQKKQMLRCFMAGWVEVIRGFGHHPDGGFGIDRAKPKAGITGFSDREFMQNGCFDAWATNRTMVLGWADSISTTGGLMRAVMGFAQDAWSIGQFVMNKKDSIPGVKDYGSIKGLAKLAAKWTIDTETFRKYAPNIVRKPLEFGKAAVDRTDEFVKEADFKVLKTNRFAWLQIHYRVWRYRFKNKNGTELARGAIGSFSKAEHGGKYNKIASYTEPRDLETLPDRDEAKGKDKQSWYGLFNRAHAEHWCLNGDELLDRMRKRNSSSGQAACRYLADRLYNGTDPGYKGAQGEVRRAPNNKPVAAICSYFGRKAKPGRRVNQPVTLAPGYVEPKSLGARSADGRSHRSVANWCARLPVVAMVDGPEANEDVVVIVKNPTKPVELRGFDFLDQPGRLELEGAKSIAQISGGDIASWSQEKIRFKLPEKARNWDDGDYPIVVSLSNKAKLSAGAKRQSVGRFLVRIKRELPKVKAVKVTRDWDKTVFYNRHPEQKKVSKRLHPETFRTRIRFDVAMDRDSKPRIWIAGLNLAPQGDWLNETDWEGTVVLPDDDSFDEHIGNHALVISAKAESGAWLDMDPKLAGFQPDQSHRLRFGRLPPAPPALDLTGCYKGAVGQLQLDANVGQVNGRASWKPYGKPSVWFEISGGYMPPDIELRHKYTRATAPRILDGYAPHMVERALQTGLALEYHLKPYASKTPEGELEPAYLGGTAAIYPDKLTIPLPASGGRLGGSMDLKGPSNAEYPVQFRRLDGRGYEMAELRVTDRTAAVDLAKIGRDQPFWVTVKARQGCPILAEKLYLSMGTMNNPNEQRWITLVETDKDSRVFTSPKAGFQMPWNIPEGENRAIRIASAFHPELKPVDLVVVGSDAPWSRVDATPILLAGPQPLQAPGSPMSLIDDGSGRPRVSTPTPSGAPSAMADPTISYMDAQNRSYLAGRRRDVRNMRDNAEAMRRQAKQLGGEGRALMEKQAAAIAAAADVQEAVIDAAEKRTADMVKNARKQPKLSRQQWRQRLTGQIKQFEATLTRERKRAAATKDPAERREIERGIRQTEAIIQRLKEQISQLGGQLKAAKKAPAAPAPAARKSKTRDELSKGYRATFERMRKNVEDGWAQVKKLEAKAAKASSEEQRKQFQTRAANWRTQTERMAAQLPAYLNDARRTFEDLRQPPPKWIEQTLSALPKNGG